MPKAATISLLALATLGNWALCVLLPKVAKGSRVFVAVAGIFAMVFAANFAVVN
jgi:hypothetical protein